MDPRYIPDWPNQAQKLAILDHVQVRNVYALLNSNRYPVVDMNLNFATMKISRAYRNLMDFKEEHYRINNKQL